MIIDYNKMNLINKILLEANDPFQPKQVYSREQEKKIAIRKFFEKIKEKKLVWKDVDYTFIDPVTGDEFGKEQLGDYKEVRFTENIDKYGIDKITYVFTFIPKINILVVLVEDEEKNSDEYFLKCESITDANKIITSFQEDNNHVLNDNTEHITENEFSDILNNL